MYRRTSVQNPWCHESQASMARALTIAVRTVVATLQRLEAKGWVERRHRHSPVDGHRLTDHIRPIHDPKGQDTPTANDPQAASGADRQRASHADGTGAYLHGTTVPSAPNAEHKVPPLKGGTKNQTQTARVGNPSGVPYPKATATAAGKGKSGEEGTASANRVPFTPEPPHPAQATTGTDTAPPEAPVSSLPDAVSPETVEFAPCVDYFALAGNLAGNGEPTRPKRVERTSGGWRYS